MSPTNYLESYDLEKRVRIALEIENIKLLKENGNFRKKQKDFDEQFERSLQYQISQLKKEHYSELSKCQAASKLAIENAKKDVLEVRMESNAAQAKLLREIASLRSSLKVRDYLLIFTSVVSVASIAWLVYIAVFYIK